MTESDKYLVKLKGLDVPNRTIAAKLGISIEEVEFRWRTLTQEFSDKQTNGYLELCEFWRNLCEQYQALGESLKVLGGALNDVVTDEEVRRCIYANDVEKTLRTLKKNLILLPVFHTPALPLDSVPASSESEQN